jgi:hypothetical protein
MPDCSQPECVCQLSWGTPIPLCLNGRRVMPALCPTCFVYQVFFLPVSMCTIHVSRCFLSAWFPTCLYHRQAVFPFGLVSYLSVSPASGVSCRLGVLPVCITGKRCFLSAWFPTCLYHRQAVFPFGLVSYLSISPASQLSGVLAVHLFVLSDDATLSASCLVFPCVVFILCYLTKH